MSNDSSRQGDQLGRHNRTDLKVAKDLLSKLCIVLQPVQPVRQEQDAMQTHQHQPVRQSQQLHTQDRTDPIRQEQHAMQTQT